MGVRVRLRDTSSLFHRELGHCYEAGGSGGTRGPVGDGGKRTVFGRPDYHHARHRPG